MIQRIQTLYLIFIAGIMLAMLFLPVLKISFIDETLAGTEAAFSFPTWIYTCLVCLVIVLALYAVFLYKRRSLQIKFCYAIAVLIPLIYIYIFFLYRYLEGESRFMAEGYNISILFPIIALILDVLAVKGIKKDEKLVRSLDRIR